MNEISLGSATSNRISGHTTAADIIADIQRGKWKRQIAALRSATGENADKLKKLLLAILWAGKFKCRKNDGIEIFSGYLCADIDDVAERIAELHDIARNDPHVVACFVSPGGKGIKIVFAVLVAADAKQHHQNFVAVRAHVRKIYNAQVDEAAKDVARLCFVSHDPAAFYNAEAVPLDVTIQPATFASVQPQNGAEIGGRNNAAFNLACECRDKGQTSAEAQAAVRDFAAKCNPPLPEVEADGCVKSAFSQPARSHVVELIARLEARIYSPTAKPVEPMPRFCLAGIPICTPGNLTTISAQAKAGKSAVIGAMAGSTFAASDADCLGFTSENPHGLAVVHVDSEQCPFDHWELIQRTLRRAKADASPSWLRSYCLTGFSAADVRLSIRILTAQAAKNFGGVHSVFVDGIADAAHDVNDPAETSSLITELHKLAIEFDCPVLNIVHLNPGSDFKTRGHLGSQLERKSETNLRLEKDGDGVTVIFADKNRRAPIPKTTGPRFVWSAEHQMHVSADSIGNLKKAASLEELREQCRETFSIAGKSALTWTDFVASAKRVPGVNSQRSAERIHTDAKREKIIIKNIVSQWELA